MFLERWAKKQTQTFQKTGYIGWYECIKISASALSGILKQKMKQ